MKNKQSVKENKSLNTQEQSLNNENKIVITTKFTNDEVKVKKPYKEPFIGKVFKATIVSIVATGLPFVTLIGYSHVDYKFNPNNRIFHEDKVKESLRYFGGDERYISLNEDIFLDNELISHMKTNGKPIKIGLDENLAPHQKRACLDAIDYLNDIFKIINPKYKFKVSDEHNKYNSKIWVTKQYLEKENAIALANPQARKIAASVIKDGRIYLNTKYENQSYINWKSTFLHEMMHVLLFMTDLDYSQSKTFSVMNYNDGWFIDSHLTKLSNAEKEKGNINNKYERFTSLMPIDVAALISVYGDFSKHTNILMYTELINKTLNECIDIFGHNKAYLNEGNSLHYYYESPDNEIQR